MTLEQEMGAQIVALRLKVARLEAEIRALKKRSGGKISELLDWENRALKAEAELAALKGEKP